MHEHISETVLARLSWKDLASSLIDHTGALSAWRDAGGLPFLPRGNPVFMVHKVATEADDFFPALPVEQLDALVGILAHHYHLISFAEMAHRINDGSSGPRDACLTFDDGYRETHRLAEPSLRRHGAVATTFLVSAGLDGELLWTDQLAVAIKHTRREAVQAPEGGDLPLGDHAQRLEALLTWKDALRKLVRRDRDELMKSLLLELGQPGSTPSRIMLLSRAEVAELAPELWQVGSHTAHHVRLDLEPEASCLRELCESRQALENVTQREVTTLAYPHGGISDALPPLLIQAGYHSAATTALGANYPGTDPFRIQRATAYWPTSSRIAVGIEREFYRLPAPGTGSQGPFMGREAAQLHAAGML